MRAGAGLGKPNGETDFRGVGVLTKRRIPGSLQHDATAQQPPPAPPNRSAVPGARRDCCQGPPAWSELGVMNSSKPNSPACVGRRTGGGHCRPAVRWSVSPHPSPLPWGEGEPFALRSTIQTSWLSLRGARCSLSLRERVRVRGNDELEESWGEVGDFPK